MVSKAIWAESTPCRKWLVEQMALPKRLSNGNNEKIWGTIHEISIPFRMLIWSSSAFADQSIRRKIQTNGLLTSSGKTRLANHRAQFSLDTKSSRLTFKSRFISV